MDKSPIYKLPKRLLNYMIEYMDPLSQMRFKLTSKYFYSNIKLTKTKQLFDDVIKRMIDGFYGDSNNVYTKLKYKNGNIKTKITAPYVCYKCQEHIDTYSYQFCEHCDKYYCSYHMFYGDVCCFCKCNNCEFPHDDESCNFCEKKYCLDCLDKHKCNLVIQCYICKGEHLDEYYSCFNCKKIFCNGHIWIDDGDDNKENNALLCYHCKLYYKCYICNTTITDLNKCERCESKYWCDDHDNHDDHNIINNYCNSCQSSKI